MSAEDEPALADAMAGDGMARRDLPQVLWRRPALLERIGAAGRERAATAPGRVARVAVEPHARLASAAPEDGGRGEERLGVGVPRAREQLGGRRLLDDPPE